MNLLQAMRADGPLVRWLRRPLLPVPETLLLVLAATLVLLPSTPIILGRAHPSAWPWVLAGIVAAVLAATGRVPERLGWPAPALLRAIEFGVVLVLVGADPWGYGLLAALAFHHYDVVYRGRIRGEAPPRWLMAVTGGWELRSVALVAGAALGHTRVVTMALAVLLTPIYVTEAALAWTGQRDPAPSTD